MIHVLQKLTGMIVAVETDVPDVALAAATREFYGRHRRPEEVADEIRITRIPIVTAASEEQS